MLLLLVLRRQVMTMKLDTRRSFDRLNTTDHTVTRVCVRGGGHHHHVCMALHYPYPRSRTRLCLHFVGLSVGLLTRLAYSKSCGPIFMNLGEWMKYWRRTNRLDGSGYGVHDHFFHFSTFPLLIKSYGVLDKKALSSVFESVKNSVRCWALPFRDFFLNMKWVQYATIRFCHA